MEKTTVVGVDIARTAFDIAVSDIPGQVSQRRRLPRSGEISSELARRARKVSRTLFYNERRRHSTVGRFRPARVRATSQDDSSSVRNMSTESGQGQFPS